MLSMEDIELNPHVCANKGIVTLTKRIWCGPLISGDTTNWIRYLSTLDSWITKYHP